MSKKNNESSRTVRQLPSTGTALRTIAVAFDVKNGNKRLDRLSSGGGTEKQFSRLFKEVITPLAEAISPAKTTASISDDSLVTWMESSLKSLLENHAKIRQETHFIHLPKEEIQSVLVRSFYVPRATELLCELHDLIGGPNPVELFDESKRPIAVVLDWADQQAGCDITKAAIRGKKTPADPDERKNIQRWRRGERRPTLTKIKNLVEAIKSTNILKESELRALRIWLIIARALSDLERRTSQPIKKLMGKSMHQESPTVQAVIEELTRAEQLERSRRVSMRLIVRRIGTALAKQAKMIKGIVRMVRFVLKTRSSRQFAMAHRAQRKFSQLDPHEAKALESIAVAHIELQSTSTRRHNHYVPLLSYLHFAYMASNDDLITILSFSTIQKSA